MLSLYIYYIHSKGVVELVPLCMSYLLVAITLFLLMTANLCRFIGRDSTLLSSPVGRSAPPSALPSRGPSPPGEVDYLHPYGIPPVTPTHRWVRTISSQYPISSPKMLYSKKERTRSGRFISARLLSAQKEMNASASLLDALGDFTKNKISLIYILEIPYFVFQYIRTIRITVQTYLFQSTRKQESKGNGSSDSLLLLYYFFILDTGSTRSTNGCVKSY